ncbi:LRR receptor-like serine/threonine-protein kinase FEI 1 [Gossypium hirsutum]|uniref:non-specific serine/threonine protein kinase n=1 Tax=Gossypium hirsutum TaxID=3635 RepID=A0ABM3AMY6_GOSHI|nr:LRR receptor-like serine/threonine-protein kinase FEI 1 [Gossypium hirsutum]
MASNLLEGPIPLDIESLNALQYLDLSDNKLSGRITLQIGGLSLYQLDLSHNILQGVKPSQWVVAFCTRGIYSNKDLCGSIQGFLPCPSSPSVNQERNSKVKHNLLVFILTSSKQQRNLISNIALNGWLWQCLQSSLTECIDDEVVEMDWIKRVNIVKGVAHALSYMHHDYNPPIVHRDISSNNILLNSELEAFIVDFGTARFLTPDSSNQTVIVGTYGYIAPEQQFTLRRSDDSSPLKTSDLRPNSDGCGDSKNSASRCGIRRGTWRVRRRRRARTEARHVWRESEEVLLLRR